MGELLHRVKETAKRPLAISAMLLAPAGVVMACGTETSQNISADKQTAVKPCEARTANFRAGDRPFPPSTLVNRVQTDLQTLHRRAEAHGNQLNVPSLPAFGDEPEVLATPDSITVSARSGIGSFTYDHFTFSFAGENTKVNDGSVACLSGSNTFPNGVYTAIETYVQQTNDLDR
jgi:hypothetical protein